MIPLRIGVLGAADIAVRRTLPALRTIPDDAVLVAVASRAPDRAAWLAGQYGARAYGSYAALLDDPDVDAVYLPLPAGLHGPWIERCLAAGKHVLAEKPLATDRATAERLLRLATARGLVLAENMTFPFHSQHTAVARLVIAGRIGELRSVQASFCVPPRPAGDIRYQAALGGGSLLDQGVYPIRAALLHLGPGLRVDAATLRHDPVRAVDLGGTARLCGPDGTEARLVFGMDGDYSCHYELTGTRGSIRVQRAFTTPPGLAPQVWLQNDDTPGHALDLPPDDQFARCLSTFVARVRAGSEPGPGPLLQAAAVDDIRSFSTITSGSSR
ncbi:Gfo/Idh/MocA family protein [Winogradskya humida]|uniref:Oxidoreductase n=1 Tax=Winogradskya humida TaxID=113566 RepID=A0ABQ3ZH60_9ACTN|nr:Gfo/Idh/MocA family oxidoreductase [Actinoplanes humidus]GIE17849.1 oxidoreductase [Actinoplanes humidus]